MLVCVNCFINICTTLQSISVSPIDYKKGWSECYGFTLYPIFLTSHTTNLLSITMKFVIVFALFVASALAAPADKDAQILRNDNNVSEDGYNFA